MRTSEKKHKHGPSEEEDNPFGEEDDPERTCGNSIPEDILGHIDDSRSSGNRHREGTRRFATKSQMKAVIRHPALNPIENIWENSSGALGFSQRF
jgi:hypothetical protein